MCDQCAVPPEPHDALRVTRRAMVAGALAAPAAAMLASRPAAGARYRRQSAGAAVPIGDGVTVIPRSSWGGDLAPVGPLEAEATGDVVFLLVHHTVSSNGYASDDVVGLLRGIFNYHTGEKGWPDVAYNFFVDAYGQVWEGRTGSLSAPIKGDATGGSQGHAMLCCFVGDHQSVAPTAPAQRAMVALLAWLGTTYGIDTSPGATTSFVSRGSQRWPAGATVTTTTIAGHREMSNTVCPGDAAHALVRDEFPARVTALRGSPPLSTPPTGEVAVPTSATTSAAPTTTSSTTPSAAPASASSSTATAGESTTTRAGSVSSTTTAASVEVAAPGEGSSGAGGGLATVGLGAVGVVCGAAGAVLVWRSRRADTQRDDESPPVELL